MAVPWLSLRDSIVTGLNQIVAEGESNPMIRRLAMSK